MFQISAAWQQKEENLVQPNNVFLSPTRKGTCKQCCVNETPEMYAKECCKQSFVHETLEKYCIVYLTFSTILCCTYSFVGPSLEKATISSESAPS